jgi:hypothetical protein
MTGHEEATVSIPGVPRFEAIVEQRAARLGKSVEQLLADDRAALRQADYPGPDCLNPQEVEQFFAMDLPLDRVPHVGQCPLCAALLDVARPTEDGVQRFLDDYRRLMQPPKPADAETAENPVRRPLIDLLCVVAPTMVAVLAVMAGIRLVGDTIMRNLLATAAVPAVAQVFVAASLMALLTVAAAKWPEIGRRAAFQRFGGAAAGGVFAVLLVSGGARLLLNVSVTYANLQMAQHEVLTAYAEQYRRASDILALSGSTALSTDPYGIGRGVVSNQGWNTLAYNPSKDPYEIGRGAESNQGWNTWADNPGAGISWRARSMLWALQPDNAGMPAGRGAFDAPANASAAIKLTVSPDSGLPIVTSTKFPGKLIAQKQQNAVGVYWRLDKRESIDLGTIYKGTLEDGANGRVMEIGGDNKIGVAPSLLERAPGSGTLVLVWVPTNAREASAIWAVGQTPGSSIFYGAAPKARLNVPGPGDSGSPAAGISGTAGRM